jgi:predicted Na+-dependent transporter
VIPATVLSGLFCGHFLDTSALRILILPTVVLMIYPSMIGFNLRELAHLREGRIMLLALFINFLLVPLTAYVLGLYFLFDSPGLFAGIVIVSLLPTSNMTVAYTMISSGNVKAAIKVTVMSFILGSLLTPWYLHLLLGKYVPVDSVSTLKFIGVIVIVPLLMGVLTFRYLMTRYTLDEFNNNIKPFLPGICSWGAVLIIFISISMKSRAIFANPDVLAVALLVQCAFYLMNYAFATVGSRLCRFSKEDGYALVYCTVLRNLTIAMGLASALFGNQAVFMVSLAFLFQPVAAVWFERLNEKYRLV